MVLHISGRTAEATVGLPGDKCATGTQRVCHGNVCRKLSLEVIGVRVAPFSQ